MQKIKLSNGMFALVDDEDYEFLSQFKWQAVYSKFSDSYYAHTQRGGRKNRKTFLMHRIIMNTPSELRCDHKNHNTLDNQKQNLRNATHSQNGMNSRTRKDNRLGEKCIRQIRCGSYNVRITKDKVVVFDKCFPTLEIAKEIRDVMILKIHGEFAYTGEPQ